ncbi:MAG: hypothetical protein ACUVWZ_12675 [Anaerolineae bacterium]
MNRERTLILLALALLLPVLSIGGDAVAQTSALYNLEWHVIGGGGHPVASAHYLVNSTAGQGAASPPYSASTHYVVSGGYWFAAVYHIYLPVTMKLY